jgi:hypothetical protein
VTQRKKVASDYHKLGTTIPSLAVLIGSLILTVAGVLDRLTTKQTLTSIMAVITFIAFSQLLERVLTLSKIEKDIATLTAASQSRIGLVRSGVLTPHEAFLEDARDVLIVGLNKIGLVLQRTNFLSKLLQRGCKIRLVILDPGDVALLKRVALNLEIDAKRLQTDIESALLSLRTVRSQIDAASNKRLQVRLSSAAPSLGVTLVDALNNDGRLQVYAYAYHTDPGDRPAFEMSKSMDFEWFAFFHERYELMWKDVESLGNHDPTQ